MSNSIPDHTVVAKIVRTPDRSENIDWYFFASKTWLNFIMFVKHADGCSEHNKYQMNLVILFLFVTFIFGMFTFCSNYSSTSLWHSVNIFPENLYTNVIPCLLQLKPKAFLWMYNRSVQFSLFSNFAQWGWGPDFEGASPSLSMFQQIPSVADGEKIKKVMCYFTSYLKKVIWLHWQDF